MWRIPPMAPESGPPATAGRECWDAESGALLLTRDAPAYTVAFDPEGSRLVVGAGDASADIVDIPSGRTVESLNGHSSVVLDAQFDPSGQRVVTASADGSARIWDAATGSTLLELRTGADAGTVYSAVFSPDGTRVLTGQDDGTAIVWDSASGERLATYRADSQQVHSAVFTPDGKRIIAAGLADLTARVFACDVCGSTDEVMAFARGRLTRDLTSSERALYLHEPVAAVVAPVAAVPASPSVPPGTPNPLASATLAPESSPQATSAPTSAPTSVPDPLGAEFCAGPRSSCELSAGRFHAGNFRPPLSLAVDEGWQNDYVTPGTIGISRPDGGSSLWIFGGPTEGLLAGRVIPIGPGPAGIVDLVRRQYGLRVSQPVATKVDGFDAVQFDVINHLGLEVDIVQQDEGVQGLAPHEHDRWTAVDVRGTTVLITGSVIDPSEFDARQADLQKIVDSIAFDPPETPGANAFPVSTGPPQPSPSAP